MTARIARMPARRDTVEIGPECPLIIVCLEEWAAVARLTGHKSNNPSAAHKAAARLLAEGAKAGIRVVTLVQRAEATVVGSFERDQSVTRISFGLSDPNSLKFLHPDPPGDLVAIHGASAPGVALMTAPGLPLVRFRAPWLGSYAAYVDLVARASGAGEAVAA